MSKWKRNKTAENSGQSTGDATVTSQDSHGNIVRRTSSATVQGTSSGSSSSTLASSSSSGARDVSEKQGIQQDDMYTTDREKHIASENAHLRTFGRPDVRREPRYYMGWTLSRWLLLIANTVLMLYGSFFLLGSVVTFSQGFKRAVVIVAANRDILGVVFTASLCCVGTSILGYFGIRHKDQRVLAIYSLLLWLCMALIITVGYLAFKHNTWNLSARLGVQWRHSLSDADRVAIQDSLHCCGFDNPSDHAVYFERCWPESLLPGCQWKFYLFEKFFLVNSYTVAFVLLPIHIAIIMTSLLCTNHIEHLFGTRPRPPIPYLGRCKDWREWEQMQKKLQQDTTLVPPPAVIRNKNE